LLITKVSPTLVYSLAHLYRYTRTLNSIYSNSAGGLCGHTSSAGNDQHHCILKYVGFDTVKKAGKYP